MSDELTREEDQKHWDTCLTRYSYGCYDPNAGWSSLVARWAHNPKVGGSNPPPATKYKPFRLRNLRGFFY